jgi:protein-tyrosine phosphatase
MTTAPLPVEGTYNLRDLGGFRADGGSTRAGALFRSDALDQLSDRGREQFAGLGVVRVIDLRDDRERLRSPDLLPDTAALIPHPIFPSAEAHIGQLLDIFSLTELIYLEHGDTLAAAVTMLAEPGAGATLFHCTAGKDRTGAVAALALLAVGVDRDDVMHDYAVSETHLSGEWYESHIQVLRGLDIEVTPLIEQLVGRTPIEAIDRALAEVERRHGSTRDYLRANGVADDALERLHALLVA